MKAEWQSLFLPSYLVQLELKINVPVVFVITWTVIQIAQNTYEIVLRSFCALSGLALLRTFRKSDVRALIREWM